MDADLSQRSSCRVHLEKLLRQIEEMNAAFLKK
jgi:hypothetical protein